MSELSVTAFYILLIEMDSSKTYTVNNSTVTIKFGDLLESNADVLVISGSIGVPMIGGFPETVRNRGGSCLAADASKHSDAKLGDVVVTSAGRLSNKYLFHAVTVSEWTDVKAHISSEENMERQRACEFVIGHTISKSLRLLLALDLNSIALPCLGLGMANMPMDIVAKVTAETICRHLSQTNKPIAVEIYIYDSYKVYNKFDYLPFFECFAVFSHKWHNDDQPLPEPAIVADHGDRLREEINKIEKSPHRLFISYSSLDRDKANRVCGLLREMNVSFWIDREGIFSGSNYKELIVKAISTTDVVLFLSSENSNKSDNVAKEISLADQYNKIIIPVHFDQSPVNPSIAYDLAGIDYLELYSFDASSISKLKTAILGQLSIADSTKHA